ncbi:Multidrug resistance protein MdtE precursor [Aquisphaera giovannonii]|uniref:Multidrug resistance protein MdtE n=1 Tax=Aquisphaera giovannonii TaxID=406548 RepID=A0A5B9W136_9BACT|nr:efflux RND transporter periplasmic adaptor subunit [Aquisphaera giovannonii]QEH34228.1 Multidrug resistance protein MdtE precursor [Aquisphaera giovannonii]
MARRANGWFLLLAAAAAAGCSQAKSSPAGMPTQAEPMVVYDSPIRETVTDFEDFPGRTDAITTVSVRARVSGYLKRVYFQDGQRVRKGDVLFQIDDRPFQAALDRAKATLQQADAHSKRLNNEFRRAKVLYDQGRSISREEFDRYAFDAAEADATFATAKANLDLAALDLEWTNVTADLPEGAVGRLSRRLVDPGNLIKADETMMTTIITEDPLYVYFDVHEQAMLRIRRLIAEGKVKARSEKEVTVKISLSDEKDAQGNPIYSHEGTVDFTDNHVDMSTGTLQFRARMANPNQFITPGLFVKVRLPIGDPHPALLVREQSLQSDQGLKKVFVLEAKDADGNPYVITDPLTGKPALDKGGKPIPGYKPVAVDVGQLGVLRGKFREVNTGVKEGDLVVAQGMQKIRLGTNPVTGKPFLVKARPWAPDDDASTPASARAGSQAAAGASAAETSPVAPASKAPAAGPAAPAGGRPTADAGGARPGGPSGPREPSSRRGSH